ncbi:kinase-like protein [Artomyces pyxidatus]|uniref:Kinase-like protein n=1 Tax=Artomyces pyxidatus TaxID=48021 RepID=A0ACB8SGS0_9AGAM|nr:kinase-like protein [Artomyces pyxidatus]
MAQPITFPLPPIWGCLRSIAVSNDHPVPAVYELLLRYPDGNPVDPRRPMWHIGGPNNSNHVELLSSDIGARHCTIESLLPAGQFICRDLISPAIMHASTDPLLVLEVNNTRIPPGHIACIEHGDKLQLGSTQTLLFHIYTTGSFETRYNLLFAIGDGPHGFVSRALNRSTGQLVAVKQLRRHIPNYSAAVVRRFKSLLLTLRHHDLAKLIDVFDEGDDIYLDLKPNSEVLVMALYPLGTLQGMIWSCGAVCEADASSIVKDLCNGLQYLHTKNIVHGNVQPENIFVEAIVPLRVKLGDFGVLQRADPKIIKKWSISETYAPPEVPVPIRAILLSQCHESVDSWSVGLTLFYIIYVLNMYGGEALLSHYQSGLIVLTRDPGRNDDLCVMSNQKSAIGLKT